MSQSKRKETDRRSPRTNATQQAVIGSQSKQKEIDRDRDRDGDRDRGPEDWAYGIHTLEEMIQGSVSEIEEIMVADQVQGKLLRLIQEASERGILVRRRPKTFLSRLLGDVNHQGVGIRVKTFPYTPLEELLQEPEGKALVFAVGIQDPGNLGALLRSAQALGASGVILAEREGCGINATVRKTSAGAISHIPIARVRNLTQAMQEMRDAGWWLLGLAGEGRDEIDRFDLDRPTIFLLGSEGKGLAPSVKKHCDVLIKIPMIADWDSLNVAASGAIALYEWSRQRRHRPG